jgi:diacylglycerol kinase (ATP)
MTTCLILNPTAGSAQKNAQLMEELRSLDDITVMRTEGPGDARSLAQQAAESGASHVIAAGGDGTVNEVLNGIADHLEHVTLGVLPLGTGNDIARSLGLADQPSLALKYLLRADRCRVLDLMQVSDADGSRLALNHINAGYSNLITDNITTEMKQRWGPFAYLKTAAVQLGEREEYHTSIRWDNGEVEVVDAVNVFIANGRTVAGGLRIAPTASMEDGALEVVINRAGSLVDMAGAAARVLVGNLHESDHVISRPARSLHIESTPVMAFSVDGEQFCERCVDVRVVPGALKVIVGPNYVVEPALSELGGDLDLEDQAPPST